MVMEKSLNMRNWPKDMECFFATSKKLSVNVESLHFPMFSAICRKFKIKKRDSHGKLIYGHGKVMEIFVKSVGTLRF